MKLQMAANAMEALKEDFLHCSICTNRFKVPKILPCIHSFCQGCLEKYVQRLKCQQLPCPICRKVCDLRETGVKGLQTNFYLVNLGERMDLLGRLSEVKTFSCDSCESTDASAFCFECDSKICLKCQNDHKRFPTLRSHSIIPIDEIKQPKYRQALHNAKAPFCDIHPTENLRFYCKTCSKLICRDCTIVQHPKPDHECVEASCQLDEIKRDLLAMLKEISPNLKSNLEFIKTGKAESEAVERECNTLTQEIKNTYERMKASIEKQLRSQMVALCKEVTESKKFQRNMIDEKVGRASTWVTRFENTQEVTKKIINENNVWEILAMSHDLVGAFQVLKFDTEEFQWFGQWSDLKQTMVFSQHESPSVTLGKCSARCDVVLSDSHGNFILVTFDRRSSKLQLIRTRKDNAYDLANADHIPPYKVEATIPANARVTATFVPNVNSVFIGLGRWIVKFKCSSNLFEILFETAKDEDSCITFITHSDSTGTLYFMHSNNQYVKQFTDYSQFKMQHTTVVNIESYLRNTRYIIPEDHLPIENVFVDNSSLLYSFKEGDHRQNSKIHILSQGESKPLIINSLDNVQNRQQLSVFKDFYEGSYRTLHKTNKTIRKITNDYSSCYVLWDKPSTSSGFPSTFIITEYHSSGHKIIRTWNVPHESAQPAACFKDNRTDQLMVCDLYGKVTTCFN